MSTEEERQPLVGSVTSSVNNSFRNSQGSVSNMYSSPDLSSSRIFLLPASRKYVIPGVIILFLVLLERIAFYSLTSNLYLFLNRNELGWSADNAMSALFIFTGTSYLSSLFGGWLSDSALGRFKTIALAFLLFTGAYWFLPFTASLCPTMKSLSNSTNGELFPTAEIPMFKENCNDLFMAILVIAAIGTGTVKANITPFGAEQVRYSGPVGLRIYLNWLYWCVNIGAFIAILGIAYVQQAINFHWGYLIPAVILSVATLLFLVAYPLYTCQSPSGSAISRTFSVLKEAWKSNKERKNRNIDNSADPLIVNTPSWLDMAKVTNGGKYHESAVEDVKSLRTIIIVFVSLIPYWILYFQMQTTFLLQGLHLRLNPFSPHNGTDCNESHNEFFVPAAWLMLFNVLFLIFFIPLMNYFIYPCLDRHGMQPSMFARMIFGMLCATCSMIMAGSLEMCRFHYVSNNTTLCQVIEQTNYIAADLSIFWQIPQYALIGISEVFTSVTGMEFACSQAPTSMQGAIMGLYYFSMGIGSFLGIIVMKAFEELYKTYLHDQPFQNVNIGHLSYYFFFLAVLQFLSLVIFFFISGGLKIRKTPSPITARRNTHQEGSHIS